MLDKQRREPRLCIDLYLLHIILTDYKCLLQVHPILWLRVNCGMGGKTLNFMCNQICCYPVVESSLLRVREAFTDDQTRVK